jgi:bis(5'-nucleosyl)-tetraphosphatase (symmetrical)
MATYAIGDVQGCGATLRRLIARLSLDPVDRVWFVGDLVNRGPSSLDVLRQVRDLGDRAVVVLGNHDLHLLAESVGIGAPSAELREIHESPDRDELLAWLRGCPLLHREGDSLMIHAGLLPGWTAADAQERARQAESVLQGEEGAGLLRDLYYPPAAGRGELDDGPGTTRLRRTIEAQTRLRICDEQGRMNLGFKEGLDRIPDGFHPWFRAPGRRTVEMTVIFGHWARLGLVQEAGVLALDTGCVYGNLLTAVCLEDRRVIQEQYREP